MRFWRSVLVVVACVGATGLALAAQEKGAKPPIRAPGLWHVSGYTKLQVDGHKEVRLPIGKSSEQLVLCSDVASEMKRLEEERNRKSCPVKFGRDGKDFTREIDCTLPSGFTAKEMELIVVKKYADGEHGRQMDSYHISGVVQMSVGNGSLNETWTRIGACPIGTKGGDVGVIKDGQFRKLAGAKAAALMDRSLFGY